MGVAVAVADEQPGCPIALPQHWGRETYLLRKAANAAPGEFAQESASTKMRMASLLRRWSPNERHENIAVGRVVDSLHLLLLRELRVIVASQTGHDGTHDVIAI